MNTPLLTGDELNVTKECRLCGHQISVGIWGGGECASCGSVSVERTPTSEELTDFYRKFNETYKGGGSSEGKNLNRYAQKYLDIVSRFSKSGSLIDIGSSTNPFPDVAFANGFDVTVLDYIKPRNLSESVRYVCGSIDDETIPGQIGRQFDAVSGWAVIEHLPRPLVSVKLMVELCRPGGFIFLSTPEIGTNLTRFSLGRSGWFYPPEHLNLVSPKAVETAFAAHECALVEWGRLELSLPRFAVRYGIGVFESLVGMPAYAFLNGYWRKLRDTRRHLFKGVTYFVLRRGDAGKRNKTAG